MKKDSRFKKRKSDNFKVLEDTVSRGSFLQGFLVNLGFSISSFSNFLLNGHLITKYRIKKYLSENSVVRVQFGSGDKFLDGFLNTGVPGRVHVNISKGLPFPDSSVDLIFSSHVIEHISPKNFKFFLKESYRILKPGGYNLICTPDLEKIVNILYIDKGKGAEAIKRNLQEYTNRVVTPAFYIQGVSHMFFNHRFLYDLDEIVFFAGPIGYGVEKVLEKGYKGFNINEFFSSKSGVWNLTNGFFVLKKE